MSRIGKHKGLVHVGLAGAVVLLAVTLIFTVCIGGAAAAKKDYKCNDLALGGCELSYPCTTWTTQPCTSGGSSKSKRGCGIPFHICVTSAGGTCTEVSVLCYQEVYYLGTNCSGGICATINQYTIGCVPIQ